MPKHSGLPKLLKSTRPTDRLFVALFPDAETAARIGQLAVRLRTRHGPRGKLILPDRLHITLQYLGDYVGFPERMVAMAIEAMQAIAMPPVDVALDRAASFCSKPRNRPFVLLASSAPLVELQQAIGSAMSRVGLARLVDLHLTPHLTLLYDDHCVPEHAIEPIRWTAREFVLVHSLLGRTRHIPLARWQLRG